LIGVERLGVSSVILVEVCEFIVEENWARHVRRDGELKCASCGLDRTAANQRIIWSVADVDLFPRPCRGIVVRRVLVVEVHSD